MYLLRGVVVSLGVFFFVYVGLSALVLAVWRTFRKRCARQSAGLLYGMRVSPLLGASIAVALFTLPSFVYFEPALVQETIGIAAFTMAACGAAVLGFGFLNCVRALLKTVKLISSCLKYSRQVETAAPTPVYEVLSNAPLIFVAGLWSSKVLISSSVLALLERNEVDAAIRHEMAHVRRWDNIKKMVLRACCFPLLGSLECEWLRAAETAADDAAATSEETALSLASALVKIAALSARMKTPELGMTLLPQNGASIRVRVEKLLSGKTTHRQNGGLLWCAIFLSAALLASVNYPWLLLRTHELTELLIR